MQSVIQIMLHVWNEVRQEGSYFILALIAVIFLLHKHKDKYKWIVIYAAALFFLVIMNPVMVMVAGKMFPALQLYTPFLLLVPILFYVPLAGVELVNSMWEEKKRYLVVFLLILLISISGSFFGTTSPLFKTKQVTEEQKEVIALLEKEQAANVLAEDEILTFIPTESQNVKCLYGRDLWTPNMDLGIMDEYGYELMGLYEAMKNPAVTWKDILQTATMYECDFIVIKYYKNYPAYDGNYKLIQKTENYLVYRSKDTM